MAQDVPATYPGGDFAEAGPIAAVHVARTFPAPRERVFRAWTQADAVSRWFGVVKGVTRTVEADVRVGGSYRITMKWPPTWRTIHVVGTFLEVDSPERLVYTFAWEPSPIPALGMGDSKVTVQFREVGDGTEVSLTHELLDKRRLRSFHAWGWKGSMRRLARLL
jgi:uncharacterized protein YndB with AHSA1/START domain